MALEIHSVRSPGLNYNSPWQARSSLRGLGGLTSSSVIKRIQNFLRDQRGMAQDVGAPDGDLGAKTYNAITRVLGRGWNSLEENAIRSQVESALAPWPLGAYPPPAAVEAVQRALNLSPIDGKLGPGTWDALTRRLGDGWTMLSWHGPHSIVSLLDRGGRAVDVPAHDTDTTDTFAPAVVVKTDPTLTPGKSSVVATTTVTMQQPSAAEAVRIRELAAESAEARAKQYEGRAKDSPKVWGQRAKEARKLANDTKKDLVEAKARAERVRKERIAKTKARDERERKVAKNGGGKAKNGGGGEAKNGGGKVAKNGKKPRREPPPDGLCPGPDGTRIPCVTEAGMGPWGIVAVVGAALLAFFGGGKRANAPARGTAGVRLGHWGP